MKSQLENVLKKNQTGFRSVVDFNAATDKLLLLDFTSANKELTGELFADTAKFSQYIDNNYQQPMLLTALVVMVRTGCCTSAATISNQLAYRARQHVLSIWV